MNALKDSVGDNESEEANDAHRKSEGGLYIVMAYITLFGSGFVMSLPGGYWIIFLIPLLLSLIGLSKSKARSKRVAGIIILGLSGGLFLQDFAIAVMEVFQQWR